MDTDVEAQVDPPHRLGRHRPGRRFHARADQGQHGAVVVAVGVDVEQAGAGGGGDGVDHPPVLTFADVDHALQHRPQAGMARNVGVVDIGLALPQYDFSVPGECPLRWETLLGWAERAEALGFDSVWLSDHLFLDIARYGASPGDHGCFDPLVALAAIARRTIRVRLGTLTLCAPSGRPPCWPRRWPPST
jgi:hypothetical protein